MSLDPLGNGGRQHIEGMAEGFCDTFQPTERLNRGQHMDRSGPLTAPGFQPALVLRMLEQLLKQQRLPSSL